jgi:hypothetical protein
MVMALWRDEGETTPPDDGPRIAREGPGEVSEVGGYAHR